MSQQHNPNKITIEPVTRVEGHGKVTLHLDEENRLGEARFHITEFRGFEKFVQGRPWWEAPVMVQRLCGICPVSHHLAAAKAMDRVVGVSPENLPPTAEKMRRLMHYGQLLQSHALHYFYLAAPDLLLPNADAATRNVVGLAIHDRELAKKGILLRKFGQEVIKATAGKKIHGTSAIAGGIHKNLSEAERDRFVKGDAATSLPSAREALEWVQLGLASFRDYHAKNSDFIDGFARYDSNFLSLVRADGALDFYHGDIRVRDSEGQDIIDRRDYQEYLDIFREETRAWSYMKFPFLKDLGRESGWYRVGPLARINNCDFIPTPLAQKALEEFRSYNGGKPSPSNMHAHWARLIEMLHCAEVIEYLLADPELQGEELVREGTRQVSGIGFLEAPRGTLIHHYEVGADDLIQKCNLIVSTTHNNTAMNRAVAQVAADILDGRPKKEITEPMLNQVEIAIRAFDPCLSCATHAVGQMPLKVELFDAAGTNLATRIRG